MTERSLSVAFAFLLSAPLGLVACAGDQVAAPSPDAGGAVDADAGFDASHQPDARPDASEAGPTCDAPKTACSGACVDLKTDGQHCGACGHDCLGGKCLDGVCQVSTVATGQETVYKLVPTPTKLTWVRAKTPSQSAAVFFSNLDGKSPTPLYGSSGDCTAVTASAANVYFVCDDVVSRCAASTCGSGPVAMFTQPRITDLAFDAQGSRLYFSVGTPFNGVSGGFVASVPASGGTMARVVPADQPNPIGLILDAGYVYWLGGGTYDTGQPQYDGGVRRALLGSNQVVSKIVTDVSASDMRAFAVQGGATYWTGNFFPNGLHTAPITGGSPDAFSGTVTPSSGVGGIVADAKSVYWIEDSGGLYRCDKPCKTPALVTAAPSPTVLAADERALYWADSTGEIHALAK